MAGRSGMITENVLSDFFVINEKERVFSDDVKLKVVEINDEDYLFDLISRKIEKGPSCYVELECGQSGKWLLRVFYNIRNDKIQVDIVKYPPNKYGAILATKTVYLERSLTPGLFYHTIYQGEMINENFHQRTVNSISQLYPEIKEEFTVKKIVEVSEENYSKRQNQTLTIEVEPDPIKLTRYFYLEIIKPAFNGKTYF